MTGRPDAEKSTSTHPLIRPQAIREARFKGLGRAVDFRLPGLGCWVVTALIVISGVLSGVLLARVPDRTVVPAVALPSAGVISIRAPVHGVLTSIRASTGDWLFTGQVLAELDTGGRVDVWQSRQSASPSLAIRAPVAGRLAQILFIPGQAVNPGEVIARILPGESISELRLFVPSDQAHRVERDQLVRVRGYKSRFKTQSYGRITHIADLPLMPGDSPWSSNAVVPVFEVRARLLGNRSKHKPMLLGQQFNVEIRHGSYSIFDWWLNGRQHDS